MFFILEYWPLFLQQKVAFIFSRSGFSLMGGLLGVPIYAFLRLRSLNVPFLLFSDIVSSKIPPFQAIARFGCLFVGCCVGDYCYQDTSLFCVIYNHPHCLAPLGIPLLPLQLISALCSIIIFFTLGYLRQTKQYPQGFIFATYLIMEGLARTATDFWRLERNIILNTDFLWPISYAQVIGMFMLLTGTILLVFVLQRKNKSHHNHKP